MSNLETKFGRRVGETIEITVETIRAAGKERNLSEAAIAKIIEAVMKAEKEMNNDSDTRTDQ